MYRLRGGGVCTQTEGGSVRRVTTSNSSALRLPKPASPAGKLPSQAKVLFYRARCWSVTAIPYRCIKPSFTIS